MLTVSALGHADGARPNVVWYRGSAECPTGPQFLEKLGARASLAKLATAGDHIDFIVTLVTAPGEAVGRLERQTQTGTVAIRELRDASCENVASALVLSLGLALNSEAAGAEAQAQLPPPVVPTPVPAPSAVEERLEPEPTAPVSATPSPVVDAPRPRAQRAERPRWAIGANAGVLAGVTPTAMGAVSAFVDVDGLPPTAPQLSLRAGFVGAFGSTETTVGPVERSILAGRLEGCPLRWGSERWSVRPCVFVDIGATTAASERETTVRGTSPWIAPGAALRGAVELFPPVGLEAAFGGVFPAVRSDVSAGKEALYSDGTAALDARVGLFYRLQ